MQKYRNSDSGFSLVEVLLAIGIFAVFIAQVVGLQGSNLALTQSTRNNIRAIWAMRQAFSQAQYVIDAIGIEELPKSEVKVPWSADPTFTMQLNFKEANIEASRLLQSMMTIASGAKPKEEEAGEGDSANPGDALKDVSSLLDQKLPKDIYKVGNIDVTWKEGGANRKISGGFLVINQNQVSALFSSIPGGETPPTGDKPPPPNDPNKRPPNDPNKPPDGGEAPP